MKKMIKTVAMEMMIFVGERFGNLAVEQCCVGRFHEPKIPEELLRQTEES